MFLGLGKVCLPCVHCLKKVQIHVDLKSDMNARTKMVDGLTTSLQFMLNVEGCRGGVVNSSLE